MIITHVYILGIKNTMYIISTMLKEKLFKYHKLSIHNIASNENYVQMPGMQIPQASRTMSHSTIPVQQLLL